MVTPTGFEPVTPGSEPVVTISSVVKEKVGDGDKHVVYFEGHQKGLVLNRTNAEAIAMLYGDTVEDWIGEQVTLYATPVTFQGKTTNAVRVRPSRKAAPKLTEQNPPPDSGEHLSDEIPF
jgi:hypothetical protein